MKDKQKEKSEKARAGASALGRRDLMKMGVGAVGAGVAMTHMLGSSIASAQEESARPRRAGGAAARAESANSDVAITGAGWKNTSGRAYGNGPMDETSRVLVDYVSSFSDSILTDAVAKDLSSVMVDAMSAVMAGFESDPARICARMAKLSPAGPLKSTVFGYGVATTPEMAAYANTSMIRHVDFNDDAPGGHVSDIIPGILAVGEALHATGSQVLLAVTLGYELMGGFAGAGGDGHGLDSWSFAPATALATGKLFGLNKDQLANAVSLAIVPRVPLRVNRSGPLSMAKGCSSAPAIRDGVFSALLAREGMTGACQPFEGRDGLWDRITGPFKELRLPVPPSRNTGLSDRMEGGMCVQRADFKRYPAESQSHALLEIIPQIRAWTKADDIASIQIEGYPHMMMEIGDPPKWDPRNSDSADHSLPFLISRALIDGEIYLDSYSQEKIMDPVGRQLMEKITMKMQPDYPRQRQRITVHKKDGTELVKEVTSAKEMTHDDVLAKFNRVCAFRHVSDDQKSRILAQWSDLRSVKNFADAVHTVANFGRPEAL